MDCASDVICKKLMSTTRSQKFFSRSFTVYVLLLVYIHFQVFFKIYDVKYRSSGGFLGFFWYMSIQWPQTTELFFL